LPDSGKKLLHTCRIVIAGKHEHRVSGGSISELTSYTFEKKNHQADISGEDDEHNNREKNDRKMEEGALLVIDRHGIAGTDRNGSFRFQPCASRDGGVEGTRISGVFCHDHRNLATARCCRTVYSRISAINGLGIRWLFLYAHWCLDVARHYGRSDGAYPRSPPPARPSHRITAVAVSAGAEAILGNTKPAHAMTKMARAATYCDSSMHMATRRKYFSMKVIIILTVMLHIGESTGRCQTAQDSLQNFLRANFGFTNDDLRAVESGEIATRALGTDNPAEIAVFGTAHLQVPLEFIVAQYRNLTMFRDNALVPEIGMFSVPPQLSDLDGLSLEEEDMRALRDCRPGDCKVKLPKAMMARFNTEIDWNRSDVRSQVLGLTKAMLVEFVKSYLAEGNGALGNYDDQVPPLDRVQEYQEILREEPSLLFHDSSLFRYLDQFPNVRLTNTEDFIYWQKQKFEKIKPVFSLNHLTIIMPESGRTTALVASHQIYADHYYENSLTITAFVEDGHRSGVYLLSLIRSCFDDLRKKGIVDMRPALRDEIYKQALAEMRRGKKRLESLFRRQMEKRN